MTYEIYLSPDPATRNVVVWTDWELLVS